MKKPFSNCWDKGFFNFHLSVLQISEIAICASDKGFFVLAGLSKGQLGRYSNIKVPLICNTLFYCSLSLRHP